MNEFEELDGILDDFCIESNEMIELTSEDLLEIEVGYSEEKINRIFRTFHTIKGNSAMLGLKNLAEFSHISESLLTKIRSKEIKISKEIIDLLFKITDFIKDSIEKVGRNRKDINKTDENLENRISVITSKKTKLKSEKTAVDKKLRFLIVDDDYISRTILNHTLSKFGECCIAVDGQEALYAFMLSFEEDHPFDIIFMDINMPNLNGIDASLKIREIEKEKGIFGHKEVRIIIISSIANPREVIRTMYNCGATSYITKPYNINSINKELELIKLI